MRSVNGDTDYSDIEAGGRQGDTLAPYLFIICRDTMLGMTIYKMKDNGFKLAKLWSQRYSVQSNTDYTENIALYANTPA